MTGPTEDDLVYWMRRMHTEKGRENGPFPGYNEWAAQHAQWFFDSPDAAPMIERVKEKLRAEGIMC